MEIHTVFNLFMLQPDSNDKNYHNYRAEIQRVEKSIISSVSRLQSSPITSDLQ